MLSSLDWMTRKDGSGITVISRKLICITDSFHKILLLESLQLAFSYFTDFTVFICSKAKFVSICNSCRTTKISVTF